ncbi:hypothetical protein CYLTODRAFT_447388 [Cylindrobasidium torrendii FP15055 ss-10]|uniref:Uncharacterized protein n=1 Tax=Cylindrobasidium torrendii FP15055 ss-10 TaxID=1314674 RepID=A0A0D7AW74_9AGAR|nr:hypothetical protein CYLTODRAFT_447388 [Cylindrobasidium torrendii FP15055 ss-10]
MRPTRGRRASSSSADHPNHVLAPAAPTSVVAPPLNRAQHAPFKHFFSLSSSTLLSPTIFTMLTSLLSYLPRFLRPRCLSCSNPDPSYSRAHDCDDLPIPKQRVEAVVTDSRWQGNPTQWLREIVTQGASRARLEACSVVAVRHYRSADGFSPAEEFVVCIIDSRHEKARRDKRAVLVQCFVQPLQRSTGLDLKSRGTIKRQAKRAEDAVRITVATEKKLKEAGKVLKSADLVQELTIPPGSLNVVQLSAYIDSLTTLCKPYTHLGHIQMWHAAALVRVLQKLTCVCGTLKYGKRAEDAGRKGGIRLVSKDGNLSLPKDGSVEIALRQKPEPPLALAAMIAEIKNDCDHLANAEPLPGALRSTYEAHLKVAWTEIDHAQSMSAETLQIPNWDDEGKTRTKAKYTVPGRKPSHAGARCY